MSTSFSTESAEYRNADRDNDRSELPNLQMRLQKAPRVVTGE